MARTADRNAQMGGMNMDLQQIKALFSLIRAKKPLLHHITNHVTIQDCANIALAAGGSPVMADGIAEVEEMVSKANALVLNLGTLNAGSMKAMVLAGRKANEKDTPVIFDPVGAGATHFRSEMAARLLDKVKIDVIRGNHSEVASLLDARIETKGVDSGEVAEEIHSTAFRAAEKFNCIVAISGKTDAVASGTHCCLIQNGHEMLARITGTGCTTATLIAAFAGITKNYYHAAIAGTSTMGICGEMAAESLAVNEGLATFRIRLWDRLSLMDGEQWQKEVKWHELKKTAETVLGD